LIEILVVSLIGLAILMFIAGEMGRRSKEVAKV
jgi:hypothetical protein